MDTNRLILFFVFSFSVFMLVDAWQRDKHPQPSAPTSQAAAKKDISGAAIPVPSTPSSAPPPAAVSPQGLPPPGSAPAAGAQVVKVQTDVLAVEISTAGGDVRRLELTQHRGTLDKSKNFVLFQSTPDLTYIAQSGLIGSALPNHRTLYTASAQEYRLQDGSNSLEVRLQAPESNGVKVTQVYRFTRGSYLVEVAYEIHNDGTAPVKADAYFQLVRDNKPSEGESAMVPTYTGPATYTKNEKFQKIAWADIDKGKTPYTKSGDEGWVAIIQHYFLSAFLPKDKTPREFYTKKLEGTLYSAGVIIPTPLIEPGKTALVTVPLYAGPQETEKLEKLAPGLELVVDYGWLTVIAVPLFVVLHWIHQWVGNWGIAIILLTVLIKLIFYPLQEASYRAMAKMKIIAPKMQQLKERYGDDRQRMQKAMMELYQKEKVNPMAGCLPILVQMPVFIALYWVLLASVELRHAPFGLGINDLSIAALSSATGVVATHGFALFGFIIAPLPYVMLPVLMGATMIIQTRLNPEPPDPVQAKVMKIMPIVFSVFFFFFPAGLVLYWLVNNVLSIAQQWHINKKIEQGAGKKPAAS